MARGLAERYVVTSPPGTGASVGAISAFHQTRSLATEPLTAVSGMRCFLRERLRVGAEHLPRPAIGTAAFEMA
jgi:hypothetical protein